MHKNITEKMTKLYEAKNNDYGDSVSDTYDKFGMDAFLVRMYDKINRIYSLTRPEVESKVEDEKITDTLMDLANYAILAIIELEERKSELCQEAKETQVLLEKDYPYTTGGELGGGKHCKED